MSTQVQIHYDSGSDVLTAEVDSVPGHIRTVEITNQFSLLLTDLGAVAGFRISPLSIFSDYLALQDWLGTAALDLVAALQFQWVDQVDTADCQARADFDTHARYASRRRGLLPC